MSELDHTDDFDADTDAETEEEPDEETRRQQEMIRLEVSVNEFEARKKDLLEEAGVDVESNIAAQLQPQVENLLHDLYQQARFGE